MSLALIPATGLAAAPAGATPGTSPVGTTLTATRSAAAPNSPGAAGVTITCTLNAGQYPHKSTHVPGTVNYVATASCDAPVVSVTVAATLQPPIPYAPIHGQPGSGTISAQSNAAKACTNGNYYGYATMTVVFPPGYTPNPQTTNGTSPTKDIVC